MNIEDLIREANPVRPGDVADATSPKAQRMLARILQQDALPGEVNGRARGTHGPSVYRYRHSRHGPSPRSRKRRLIMTGVAAVAAGAAAAGLLLAVPGPAHPRTPTAVPGSKAHSSATPAAPQYTSAQQVLLAAAANVTTSAATSGKYWRLQEVTGVTWPAGTPAHPYDISVSESFDQWNPRSPGVKNWDIFKERGAVPATPADAAAWRAAGSPTSWRSGAEGGFHDGWWNGVLSTSTTHSLQGADWQRGNGIVGYVEGDEAGLTASQFAAVPTTQSGVLAFLLSYYKRFAGCQGCSSKDSFLWLEGMALLQDPVSAPVRAAAFKVMASLPGVRSIGTVTDPLGRHGYGLLPGSLGDTVVPGMQNLVVIDPSTGSLLATEDIGPMPANVHCHTQRSRGDCVGPDFTGRSYQDQVDEYTALESAGWTDASPALPPPSARQASMLLPADPTEEFTPCWQTGCRIAGF